MGGYSVAMESREEADVSRLEIFAGTERFTPRAWHSLTRTLTYSAKSLRMGSSEFRDGKVEVEMNHSRLWQAGAHDFMMQLANASWKADVLVQ